MPSESSASCIAVESRLDDFRGLVDAIPALMPTDVCMHLKKGEEWITTRCLFRLVRFATCSAPPLFARFSCDGVGLLASACSSSLRRNRPAMRAPSALDWFHPP